MANVQAAPDLNDDITHVLEGWSTHGANVTAFDRLSSIQIGILEGRYGEGVTLDTLKTALKTRANEFSISGVADEEWRNGWQRRTESLADRVDETIGHLQERH